MKYDFDMVYVFPHAVRDRMKAAGQSEDTLNEKVALFRDPRVVGALQAADTRVQAVFRAAGFGLIAHDAELPDGHFKASEADDRLTLMQRLHEALASRRDVICNHDWGGFSLTGFLDQIAVAQPVPGGMAQAAE